ncbi:MAG: T9SS type A sorting domain-containing protein [Ignavibacteriales bacterium]|nr:T9SS type A sorting domain-containing protein [Ignavibacteriales bacterium]
MPARSLAVWLIIYCAAAAAQVRPPFSEKGARARAALEHSRVDQSLGAPVSVPSAAGDTVRILALMVDFQTSQNSQTTGNGRFQLDAASAQNIIDPPPHDSAYFAYKLQFLANYFRKVSNGKVIIKGDVFGQIVTLSKTLSQYSPAKDGSNDKPLGNLIVDAWHTADSLYPALQFSRYNAFLIFHAGVGRDINLVATLGYDPAPFDLPSITFNLRTLRNYLGDQSYAGIPVSKGSFRITNTMLLPETETRVLTAGTAVDTLQGSINGLLANSFGSYLGLPDLFNTKTGESAIGQFGLMDIGGGFIFYSGLFPPEPSAWEKVFLGWVTPITVAPGSSAISLPAVGLKTGADTVYKIPITDREYFLVENRSRDPKQDGQRLTIRSRGATITRYFSKDTTGFDFQDTRTIAGSVIDVDDFDWALPALTSIEDSNYVGGGILIWHIDEDVIAQNLATNSVNADASRRGVDLEEADGSQDLGRSYDAISEPGSGTEWGYEQDFWYSGNPIQVYINVFDKNSKPNSRSNSGALSLVTVRDFSPRSARMTAIVSVGGDRIFRLPQFTHAIPAQRFVTAPSASGSAIMLGVDGKIFAFDTFYQSGRSKTHDTTGLLYPNGGGFTPAVLESTDRWLIAGVQDSSLYILDAIDRKRDGVIDSLVRIPTVEAGATAQPVHIGDRITTPAMFAELSVIPQIIVGTLRGSVWSFSTTGVLQKKLSVSSSPVTSLAQLPTPSLSKPAELFFTCGGRLYGEQSSVSLSDSSLPWTAVGVTSASGNFVVVGQIGGRRVVGFSRDLGRVLFDITIAGGGISSIAAGDIDRDGQKDIVVVAGDRVCALNRSGSYLSGFPVVLHDGVSYAGDPIIGDLNGDGSQEIALCMTNGELAVYDQAGRIIAGFPIQLTSSGQPAIAAFWNGSKGTIGIVGVPTMPSSEPIQRPAETSASTSGSASGMRAIELTTGYAPYLISGWTQYLMNSRHSNYDASADAPKSYSSEFLPRSRVYNWPNPVSGSTTQIRYYTSEDASISIQILDLAGAKVAELNATSRGGMDGEVVWDVSNVQSGVYLARIEAKGASFSEVAVIKIAIVK